MQFIIICDNARGNKKAVPGGIGEEDIVVLVLPYIKTAREGVERLAELLEKYGTYESNGIAFNDKDEVWWLELWHFAAKRHLAESLNILTLDPV